MTYELTQIADAIDGAYTGTQNLAITGISALDDIQANTIVMCMDQTSLSRAEDSLAAAVVLPQPLKTDKKPFIHVKHAKFALIKLLTLFTPQKTSKPTIHPTAVIAETASLSEGVSIGPYVTIGEESCIGPNTVIKAHVTIGDKVEIGANSTIHPNVVIYDETIIKHHVIIHAASVIGSDGFGYEFDGTAHQKIPHIGHVIIEDHVEIGANTVVDRATLGATHIGQGTKIDNLVQVAHNVKLGKNNILCAFTGIAGSSTLGDQVICAADVGIADHATIEDNVMLGPRTGVTANKRCPKDTVWLGNPARPAKQTLEQAIHLNRLPKLRKTVQALSKRVDALEVEKV